MEEPTIMTLAQILAAITSIFTEIVSWVGSVITMITSNPLILLFVVMGVALIAIGVVRRLLNI